MLSVPTLGVKRPPAIQRLGMQAEYRRENSDITPQRLRAKALGYLGRYASSSNNLRHVLLRWVSRSTKTHDHNQTTMNLWIDQVVQDLLEQGLLNDKAYAEGKIHALLRRGKPLWIIKRTLSSKGVEKDVIERVVCELKSAISNPELAAAVNLARRKKLGPFGATDQRPARKVKDMEALARAGFGFDVARSVVEAKSFEDFEF